MVTVSVSFDGTRLTTAEALSPTTPTAGVWEDTVGGAAVLDTDFFYQGVRSISEKVKTSELGICFIPNSATVDLTSGIVIYKVIATNFGVLNTLGSTAGIVEMASGATAGAGKPATNFWRWYVLGSNNYPIKGGWVIIPIAPAASGYIDNTTGTPSITTLNYWAWLCTFRGSSKSENVAMDAIDYMTSGTGLTLIGGDGASTDGVFQDFIDVDEGTLSAGRWGVVSTQEGILYVSGVLTIGTSTATVFTDSFQTIVFPDARCSAGWCGVDFSLANATNVLTLNNCGFISRGNTTTTDTRPDYTVTGTSGTLDLAGCTFDTFRTITLTSEATLTGCVLLNGLSLVQAGGTLDGCTIAEATGGDGVAFITSNNITPISDCRFVFSDGHAIEITAAGTYSFVGNVFEGYGADGTNDAAIYNNSGGTVNILVSGGGSIPTYRNGAGAATSVVNSVTVQVTTKDAADGDPVGNARVILRADTGGDLPVGASVTITRVTTTATVAHTAHGLVNGAMVEIVGADQSEYNGVKTISNVSTNAYDYTVSGTPTTPATGTITSTAVILEGLTNGTTGIILDTGFNYTDTDQPVEGWARRSTTSPLYKTALIAGTITDAGFITNTFMVADE